MSSSTLEIRSASVKDGLELMGPEVDLSMLMLASCAARLYSTLVVFGRGGVGVCWASPRE